MNRPVNFGKLFLRPLVMVLLVGIIVAVFIIGYGQILWNVHDRNLGIPEGSFRRPEIWVAAIPSVIVVIAAVAIAYSPKGVFRFLEKQTVIGHTPIFVPPAPTAAEDARSGATGSVDQIAAGYRVFLHGELLGRVMGQVPGNYLYVSGTQEGPRQLWIPRDAIETVYPETQAIFLKGRQADVFNSWVNRPTQGA